MKIGWENEFPGFWMIFRLEAGEEEEAQIKFLVRMALIFNDQTPLLGFLAETHPNQNQVSSAPLLLIK